MKNYLSLYIRNVVLITAFLACSQASLRHRQRSIISGNSPDGRMLPVKALDGDGKIYDVKAIMDQGNKHVIDVKAIINDKNTYLSKCWYRRISISCKSHPWRRIHTRYKGNWWKGRAFGCKRNSWDWQSDGPQSHWFQRSPNWYQSHYARRTILWCQRSEKWWIRPVRWWLEKRKYFAHIKAIPQNIISNKTVSAYQVYSPQRCHDGCQSKLIKMANFNRQSIGRTWAVV